MKFKSYMEFTAEAYAASSILCGLNVLILFILHFCLYCRPNLKYERPPAYDEEWVIVDEAGKQQVKQHDAKVRITNELQLADQNSQDAKGSDPARDPTPPWVRVDAAQGVNATHNNSKRSH